MLFIDYSITLNDPVDEETAASIYSEFRERKKPSQIFLEGGYKMYHIKEVFAEVKRLERDTLKLMGSSDRPTTKTGLKSLLSSNILDLTDFTNDMVKYYPYFKENRSWDTFVNYFKGFDNA